jgi:hypothetical protein
MRNLITTSSLPMRSLNITSSLPERNLNTTSSLPQRNLSATSVSSLPRCNLKHDLPGSQDIRVSTTLTG